MSLAISLEVCLKSLQGKAKLEETDRFFRRAIDRGKTN